MSAPCCTGINGSHTGDCPARQTEAAWKEPLTCWCCGGTFPGGWTSAWSEKGTRCFACYEAQHPEPCLAHVGAPLAPYRINSHGVPI